MFETADSARATRDWAVGNADTSSVDVTFGSITGLAVDTTGAFYVLDSKAFSIYKFDATGHLISTFGGYGKGPGQFTRPHGLALRGDSVVVLDDHLSVFDTTGRFIGRSAPQTAFRTATSITSTKDGYILTRHHLGRRGQIRRDSITFALYAAGELRPLFALAHTYYEMESGIDAPQAMSAPPSVAILPSGGFLHTVGDSLHIMRRSATGAPEGDFSYDVKRRRTTQSDFQSFIRSTETRQEILTDMPFRWPPRAVSAWPRAEFRPVVGALLSTMDGSLLLSRPDQSPAPYESFRSDVMTRWLQLNEKLEPQFAFELPNNFTPSVVRGCSIYGVAQDSLGVQTVERYRVSGTPVMHCSRP